MMKYRNLISIFLLPVLIGVAFLGDGLTGKVVYDGTVKPICETSNDCVNGEVCCLFFEQSDGVCSKEAMCQAVYDVTRIETQKGITDGLLNQALEQRISEEKNRYNIVFGSIILSIVGLIIISYIGFDVVFSKKEKITKNSFLK